MLSEKADLIWCSGPQTFWTRGNLNTFCKNLSLPEIQVVEDILIWHEQMFIK